jgi:predicted enzyme related to lactoylglutathione lyase
VKHVLTILAVRDLERAVRFFEEAFGWPVCEEAPVYREFRLPDGARVGLFAAASYAAVTGRTPKFPQPGGVTGTELYFHCEDLDGAIAALDRAGATLLSPRARRDWGDDAAYFADPDGNVLVVARPARE